MSDHIRRVSEALDGTAQKERLEAAAWIVYNCLDAAPAGMTEGWHVVDVITRFNETVNHAVRGKLSRYGNNGFPKR